jgi:hypothetical protein
MTNLPVVPESLQGMVDDAFFEIVDDFAHRSLAQFTSTMPDAQLFSKYNHAPAIHAALYKPQDYDPKHAIFSLNPYGNGHQPHMDIRNRVMQAVAAPSTQVVTFPNNTPFARYYSLNSKALAAVSSGDATPIAESIHNTAEEIGVETLDLITYSQGAFVGTALLKLAQERGVIQINNALIADPTNVIDRSPSTLRKAFIGTGLLNLIGAVKDSGLPALEEAQAMRGPRDGTRLARNMLAAQKGSKIPENVALHAGMTHDNIYEILGQLEANDGGFLHTRITMARAEKSKVTPFSDSYSNAAYFVARNRLEIDGYGHEAADNVTGVFALLAKIALKPSV